MSGLHGMLLVVWQLQEETIALFHTLRVNQKKNEQWRQKHSGEMTLNYADAWLEELPRSEHDPAPSSSIQSQQTYDTKIQL